ncbi:MAG: bifunctional folylpolyglutamate synthase/dihydrofolate synthase [Firmicutes bacterium]|nr:bifunctional folylpolyglutamate synthase/dihydrofolate synthase [Bacillota bacterium]
MDYNEAMRYLHGLQRFGSRLGLERIERLMALLGNPEKRFRSVHIAGTNGKGSVTAMVARGLEETGYKVGRYISPFLEEFEERISINGSNIPKPKVAELTSTVRGAVDTMLSEGYDHPTEFEIVTAMGFEYFAREAVDFASIEVGMGGRYDATNVITPMVSVITAIGYDHMERLGDTLGKIAYEKAGIIKRGVPVVTSPQVPEAIAAIEKVAGDTGSRVVRVGRDVTWSEKGCSLDGQTIDLVGLRGRYSNVGIALLGRHQQANAATAVACLELLSEIGACVDERSIRGALAGVRWPGRLEIMSRSPVVVVDGAHNQDGARVLSAAIRDIIPHRRMVMVIGILADKVADDILAELVPLANEVIVTRPNSPRAFPPEVLAEKVRHFPVSVHVEPRIAEAIEKGLSLVGHGDLLCVTGSLYLIGEARSKLAGIFQSDRNRVENDALV